MAEVAEGLEAVEAEAKTGTGEIVGTLAGQLIRVKNPKDWPVSAIRDTRVGDFDSWAEKCLVRDPEDFYAAWQKIDPTLEQVEAFYLDVNTKSGQHPGKSPASRR